MSHSLLAGQWYQAPAVRISAFSLFAQSDQVFIYYPDSLHYNIKLQLQTFRVIAIRLLSKPRASSDVQWPRVNLHIWGIPLICSIEAIKLKDVSRVPTWFEPKQPLWSLLSGCIHVARPYLNRIQLFWNSCTIVKRVGEQQQSLQDLG